MDTKLDARTISEIRRIEDRIIRLCHNDYLEKEDRERRIADSVEWLVIKTDFFTGEMQVKRKKLEILEILDEFLPHYPNYSHEPQTVGDYKF